MTKNGKNDKNREKKLQKFDKQLGKKMTKNWGENV